MKIKAMAKKYRVIRVTEDIYIKIKEMQLKLVKQGCGKTPSMSESLDAMITKGGNK